MLQLLGIHGDLIVDFYFLPPTVVSSVSELQLGCRLVYSNTVIILNSTIRSVVKLLIFQVVVVWRRMLTYKLNPRGSQPQNLVR